MQKKLDSSRPAAKTHINDVHYTHYKYNTGGAI